MKAKFLIATLFAILAACPILAQSSANTPPDGTAYKCLSNAANITGMSVSVNIASAVPSTKVPNTEYLCFDCSTVAADGSFGGNICVFVPQWKLSEFIGKYYAVPNPKKKVGVPLSARLIVTIWNDNSREYVLVLDN